jgi:hypothetical protein
MFHLADAPLPLTAMFCFGGLRSEANERGSWFAATPSSVPGSFCQRMTAREVGGARGPTSATWRRRNWPFKCEDLRRRIFTSPKQGQHGRSQQRASAVQRDDRNRQTLTRALSLGTVNASRERKNVRASVPTTSAKTHHRRQDRQPSSIVPRTRTTTTALDSDERAPNTIAQY